MAAQDPVIKEAIHEIERTLEHHALKHAVAPSAHVKDRILNAIKEQDIKDNEKNKVRVIPINDAPRKDNNFVRYFAAASIILCLISLGFNVLLYSKWKKTSNDLAALQSERDV